MVMIPFLNLEPNRASHPSLEAYGSTHKLFALLEKYSCQLTWVLSMMNWTDDLIVMECRIDNESM